MHHVFYINLDKRQDRREQIESELAKYNIKAERIQAIHTPEQGILGCTMSHLLALKMAKDRNYENVLILEDDFEFTVSKEEFETQTNRFFETQLPFDVCMISHNIQQSIPQYPEFIHKVLEAQTASGYIVNNSFYDKIIELYEEVIPLLKQTGEHWNYANDQSWKRLQPNANWYAIVPRLGRQRAGYSDNSGQFEDHNC